MFLRAFVSLDFFIHLVVVNFQGFKDVCVSVVASPFSLLNAFAGRAATGKKVRQIYELFYAEPRYLLYI